jgi:signal transduction histidine kinase
VGTFLRRWAHRHTWTSTLYAILGVPLGVMGFVLVAVVLLVGAVLTVTPLGLWLIAVAVSWARTLTGLQRCLAAVLLGETVSAPRFSPDRGVLGWRRTMLTDATGWRAVSYLIFRLPVALVVGAVTVLVWMYGLLLLIYPLIRTTNSPTTRDADGRVRHGFSIGDLYLDTWPTILLVSMVGLAVLAVAPWCVDRVLVVDRLLLRGLLGPSPLSARIKDLQETRTQAVDDATTTLRRIERDLHDGAQARLVALGMTLTMVRETLALETPPEVPLTRTRQLVDKAQEQAKEAITELRDFARGIRPPVLDKGLEEALTTLTAGSRVPVDLTTDLAARPSAAIETIAYFCAAELLTNATRHGGAQRIGIDVTTAAEGPPGDGGRLILRVSDDGRGGAQAGEGSGLIGLMARIRPVDGLMRIDSPSGGPTVVSIELPVTA